MLKVLLLTIIYQGGLCTCPDESLMSPCSCKVLLGYIEVIKCPGISTNELVNVFDSLSRNLNGNQKHFYSLRVSYGAIDELMENTFKDITFDEITISDCENLTTIHDNAFNGTELVTKRMTFLNNPVLKFENKSIFYILSKFINIEDISLNGKDQINEIASNAFRYNPMNKLLTLRLIWSFTKIESNAFSTLNNLTQIRLVANHFESISENAFAFNTPSDVPFLLTFGIKNSTIYLGLSEKSLLNIKRPTNLLLEDFDYSISKKHLEERIFLPFLLDHPNNTIQNFFGDFDCDDYRNSWFKNNPILGLRVTHVNISEAYFPTC